LAAEAAGSREFHVPRQNRPVVRDGRLQTPPKRTDRNYLKPATATGTEGQDEAVPTQEEAPAAAEAPAIAESASTAAAPPPAPAAKPAPRAPALKAAVPAAGAARALQQQGVRKRREVDVDALARRDSSYAKHELRPVLMLTAIVIATLVVLTLTLR
jgi:hypothetical protein